MAAPEIAVANCGQLIINKTFLAIGPFKTELAKSVPTDQIKTNFTRAAGTAPTQNPLAFNFEKTKINNALPVIINGIMGAKANGKSPVYIEIKLGIRQSRKADSNPKVAAEIKRRALTMDPVISWFKKYGAATASATQTLN